jgi:pimeloyl-ACP methyl ester carboxylesterase
MNAKLYITPAKHALAFERRDGSEPALLFLPGYASDMAGAKAQALDAFAEVRGLAMVRFDYSGTGRSEGAFEEGTLDRWLDEALAVVDRLTHGPVIVAGSSMGGWLGLHLALRRPERVQALVGIAAAPDFTDWGFAGPERETLRRDGRLVRESPYGGDPQTTSLAFWESGQRMRLLEGEIPIDCPVRLIHGDCDTDVPLDIAFRLKDRLRSADVQLKILKGGGHRLSEPAELAAILATVAELLESRF